MRSANNTYLFSLQQQASLLFSPFNNTHRSWRYKRQGLTENLLTVNRLRHTLDGLPAAAKDMRRSALRKSVDCCLTMVQGSSTSAIRDHTEGNDCCPVLEAINRRPSCLKEARAGKSKAQNRTFSFLRQAKGKNQHHGLVNEFERVTCKENTLSSRRPLHLNGEAKLRNIGATSDDAKHAMTGRALARESMRRAWDSFDSNGCTRNAHSQRKLLSPSGEGKGRRRLARVQPRNGRKRSSLKTPTE